MPDGVLFGSTQAHVGLRKILVEDQKLDAIVKLPGGVFKPYAGVSTAILFFTKTNAAAPTTSGSTTSRPTASASTTSAPRYCPRKSSGHVPTVPLDEADHAKNNLPDVLARWPAATAPKCDRPRTEQSFFVPKADIVAQNYDLSLNRYKEIVHEEVEHRSPLDIIADLESLEAEINSGLSSLKASLG